MDGNTPHPATLPDTRQSGRTAASYLLPAVLSAAVLALATAPYWASPYAITMLLPFFAYAIGLLGFNLLFGYGGLLSFGHAMFVATGAYTAATLTGVLGVRSIELIMLAAIAASLLIALPVGLLCVRYTRIFFGMMTLSFGMLMHSFLIKFYAITGGDTGMTVLRPTLLGMDFSAGSRTAFLIGPFYYYGLVLMLIAAAVMYRIVESPFGLHLKAQRDNALKAQYLAVKVHQYRLWAFLISAAYCAVAGVLLSVRSGNADPEIAYWTHSGELVFMTVLGGFASFLGPVIGALSFIFLRDWLMTLTEYWRLAMGVVLLLTVIYVPRGVAGLAETVIDRVTQKRSP